MNNMDMVIKMLGFVVILLHVVTGIRYLWYMYREKKWWK